MSTLPFIPKPRDIDTESLTIPLAKWAETRIRDLHNAFNDEELESRLQSIFSNSTEVVIIEGDGTTLSLEGLRGKLRRGRGEPEGVQVISVSTTADNPNQPKLAGKAIVSAVFGKERDEQEIDLTIFQDDTLIPPKIPLSGRPGYIDRRRVSKLEYRIKNLKKA